MDSSNLKRQWCRGLTTMILLAFSVCQSNAQESVSHSSQTVPPVQGPIERPSTSELQSQLTLNQAFLLTLRGHPILQQRQGSIGAAQDDIKAAQWRRFPTLTFDTSRSVKDQPVGVANSDRNAASLRLQQPLWTGNRIDSDIGMANLRQVVAQRALEETEQELLLRVVQSFSDYYRLLERGVVATANVQEHQRLYDLIEHRLAQQVTSEADVALAFARLQQAKTELITLQSLANNSRSTLEQLVGERLSGQSLMTPVRSASVWADVESTIDAVLDYSPTLRRLRTEIELAQTDVVSKRSLVMPQVSLRYEKYDGSATVVPFDRLLMVMEYQPGSGLSSLPGMDAASKRVGVAQSALETSQRDLADKATAFYNEMSAYAAQADGANQYAKAATAVMESYLRQYKAGRKSWLEVFNAQREMAQARYTDIDTTAGVVLSSYKLDILAGRVTRASLTSNVP